MRPVPRSRVRFSVAAMLGLAAALVAGPSLAQTAGANASSGTAQGAMPIPEKRPSAPTETGSAGDGADKGSADLLEQAKTAPANELFASVATAAPMAPKPIGFYSAGCLAGGQALPIDGPAWQVMRLSRNRNWGHPTLIAYLETLAREARAEDGWPGLLVGDLSQPRGGPMITGHTSHQVGLDADIWLTPMPDRILTAAEREDMSAVSMLKDPFTVDPELWTPAHTRLIRRAASDPQVARIFVHPAIKRTLCQKAGADRGWLAKVRPWWGHYYHFHVRLNCPAGMEGCRNQPPVGAEDGCDGAELAYWDKQLRKSEIAKAREKQHPGTPAPGKEKMLSDLPEQCGAVLAAGPHGGLPPPGEPSPLMRAVASKEAGPPVPELSAAALDALVNPAAQDAPVTLPLRKPR